MDIALYLKNKREELKIPRWKIATKLNISPEAYRDIEHGKTRLSLENFLIICEELNIAPMQMLKKANENYILLSDKDIDEIDKSIALLTKIKKQVTSNQNDASISNIQIGDNNSIKNSFNKK